MASSNKKVIYAALVGNGLIAITKFIAAAMTGSSAILSEGIHSVVDTGNQVLLLILAISHVKQINSSACQLHNSNHLAPSTAKIKLSSNSSFITFSYL